jgi:methylmalonyl-CoA mutase N-terminal domain/subunit
MEAEDDIVVGVNDFRMDEKERIDLLHVSENLETERKKVLGEYRSRRDESILNDALDRLQDTAREETNLMNSIVEAVEASATLGEITDVLRKVFGTYDG